MDGSAGPRTEVVHQVENQWSCDVTQAGGGCASAIRMGEMKLIIGGPGDSRTIELPEKCDPKVSPQCPVPFGLTSGKLEPGTDHARANGLSGQRSDLKCKPWCLFNLTSDLGERNDLGSNPAFQSIAEKMATRLQYHGSTGPMPAYIWPVSQFGQKAEELCRASVESGYVEPLDLDLLGPAAVLLD
eukprot:g894.t1